MLSGFTVRGEWRRHLVVTSVCLWPMRFLQSYDWLVRRVQSHRGDKTTVVLRLRNLLPRRGRGADDIKRIVLTALIITSVRPSVSSTAGLSVSHQLIM